jgi:hypothetical protein
MHNSVLSCGYTSFQACYHRGDFRLLCMAVGLQFAGKQTVSCLVVVADSRVILKVGENEPWAQHITCGSLINRWQSD